MEIISLFKIRLQEFEAFGIILKKRISRISFLRLAVFILTCFFLYIAISKYIVVLYFLSGLLFILFISFVILHKNLNELFKKNVELIRINKTEIRVLNDDFAFLPDGGEFINSDHEFTIDLDIFGKNSLYQYVNRCCTFSGKEKLAHTLSSPNLSREAILNNQYRLKELSGDLDFIQDFLSAGSLISESIEEINELRAWTSENKYPFPYWLNYIAITTAILSIIILTGSMTGMPLMKYIIPVAAINWIIYGFYIIKINRYHLQISRKTDLISKYLELNRIVAGKQFTHPELTEIQNTAENSLRQIKKLHTMINFLDQRLNIIVTAILNSLFLSDFHIIRSLEKWKQQNSEYIPSWLDVAPTMDSWLSIANFIITHPGFTFPEPIENGFSGKAISHPLIPSSSRISNDFSVNSNEKVFIITGANMAGKSTFLRTIGVNLQMAMAGMPVCAENFRFTPVEIFTGMRTNDSLRDHESYFFAELKRLKSIIVKLEAGISLFILLDEILKGTNTTDKHKGSVALIRKLISFPSITFIATHDLNLASMENDYPAEIRNYCFESYVEGTELRFDYKICQGIAKNMNATFLMQKMGIIRNG